MAECLQCGRPGGEGGTEGCGSGWFHGRRKDVAVDVGRVGFPGAPFEPNAGVEKSPRRPSCRVRGSRCLCCAFPAGEGRCPWCLLGRVSQRGRCPCMSPYAGHGKLFGVVVVSGKRRRAVFAWQAGGSRRLLELDEAQGRRLLPCSGALRSTRRGGVGSCPWETVNATSERGHGAPRPPRESSLRSFWTMRLSCE